MHKKTARAGLSAKAGNKHGSLTSRDAFGLPNNFQVRPSKPKLGKPGSPSFVAAGIAEARNAAVAFDSELLSRSRQTTASALRSLGLSSPNRRDQKRIDSTRQKWRIDQRKATIADECWKINWARTDQLVRLVDLEKQNLSDLFERNAFGVPSLTPLGLIWHWENIYSHINLIVYSGSAYNRKREDEYDELSSFFESYVNEKISERTKKLRFIFDRSQKADDDFLDKIINMINGDFESPGVGSSHLKILEQMPDDERLAPPSVYWKDRGKHPELKNASIPEFMRAVYGARLGRGFTRADLRNVDEGLYSILKEWQRRADPEKPGYINQLPEDIDLPTLEEWNNRQLETSGLSMMIEDPRFRNLLGVAATRARQKNPKI